MEQRLRKHLRRKSRNSTSPRAPRPITFEQLEERLALATNLLISVNGAYPEQLFK
jgi:hypothetical protein